MNFNTFLLFLLLIAAYLNLYLTYKKIRKSKKGTELPMSSKEWSKKKRDDSFKAWLTNKEKLRKWIKYD